MFSFRHINLGNYIKGIKTAAIVAAVAVTSLTSQSIVEAKDNKVKTIYHVYKDTAFIGNITETEKEKLDAFLDEKLTLAEQQFPSYEMEIDQDVIFIPEQVFQTSHDNNDVLDQLKEEIQVEAKTVALSIDGGEIIQLSSEQEAEQLIENFMLQYMTAEELQQFENNHAKDLQPLTNVGSCITNVELSKKVEIEESTAAPTDILTTEEALSLLNTGVKEVKTYTVKEGDVLGSIASDHDLATKDLLSLNTDLTEDTVLQIGQAINVSVQKPLIEITVSREIYELQPVAYETTVEKTEALNKGETNVKQEGQNGEKTVHYTVTQQSGKQPNN